jgi:hypothetical protein
MAATLAFFALPDDERALFRTLARHQLTIWPEVVPPGHEPLRVDETVVERFGEEAAYLAAERLGPVVVHPVKRGPNRGLLAIEEIPSPVIHYRRSLKNADGELVSGALWAELDVTGDAEDRRGKHRGLRHLFDEIHDVMRKTWRRSDPKGLWVGPRAAEAWKRDGLALREAGHKGRTYGIWR